MQEEFVPYHQHLLMKIWIQNPPKEVEVLNKWFVDLVHKVKMEVVGGPTSVYVDYPGNEGLTGTVTLATSHASIHIWDHYNPAMAQFDIYSCKCFALEDVIEQFEPWGVLKYEWVMIDRNESPHITSWLLKDIFWTLKWTWMATIMVLPTALLAIYIFITDKESRNSNLVLLSWLFMNIFWMLHELQNLPYWPVQVFMFLGILTTFSLILNRRKNESNFP